MTVTSDTPTTKRIRRTDEEKAELVRQYGLIQTREEKREWLDRAGLKPIQLAQWKAAAGKVTLDPEQMKEATSVGRKRRAVATLTATTSARSAPWPWQPEESAAIRELTAEGDPIQSALLRRIEAINKELVRCRAALDALQGVAQ